MPTTGLYLFTFWFGRHASSLPAASFLKRFRGCLLTAHTFVVLLTLHLLHEATEPLAAVHASISPHMSHAMTSPNPSSGSLSACPLPQIIESGPPTTRTRYVLIHLSTIIISSTRTHQSNTIHSPTRDTTLAIFATAQVESLNSREPHVVAVSLPTFTRCWPTCQESLDMPLMPAFPGRLSSCNGVACTVHC
jgi:hypothetical protein